MSRPKGRPPITRARRVTCILDESSWRAVRQLRAQSINPDGHGEEWNVAETVNILIHCAAAAAYSQSRDRPVNFHGACGDFSSEDMLWLYRAIHGEDDGD